MRRCGIILLLMASFTFQTTWGSKKLMTAQAQNVSITIAKPPSAVYNYASDPENLPKWAAGLSKSKLEKSGDAWIADSPMGKVKVKFAEKNNFGILDHDVTLPNGVTAHNPLRVVKNHDGSEIVFTVFRQPEMSDQDFAKDVSSVKKDLETLKRNLESK